MCARVCVCCCFVATVIVVCFCFLVNFIFWFCYDFCIFVWFCFKIFVVSFGNVDSGVLRLYHGYSYVTWIREYQQCILIRQHFLRHFQWHIVSMYMLAPFIRWLKWRKKIHITTCLVIRYWKWRKILCIYNRQRMYANWIRVLQHLSWCALLVRHFSWRKHVDNLIRTNQIYANWNGVQVLIYAISPPTLGGFRNTSSATYDIKQ